MGRAVVARGRRGRVEPGKDVHAGRQGPAAVVRPHGEAQAVQQLQRAADGVLAPAGELHELFTALGPGRERQKNGQGRASEPCEQVRVSGLQFCLCVHRFILVGRVALGDRIAHVF